MAPALTGYPGLPLPGIPPRQTQSGPSLVLSQIHEWVKQVLLKQLVHRGDAVCDLLCGRGADAAKWADASIGRFAGIDVSSSALQDAQERWETLGQPFPATFLCLDPCLAELPGKNEFDAVRCYMRLPDCFLTEATARCFLANVAALLRPGGIFFGSCPDSAAMWHKYQKAVEGVLKGGGKGAPLPVIRTPLYSLAFESPSPFDQSSVYGTKYELRLADEDALLPQPQLLVHFPTFMRLAEEVGLQCIDILNLEDFFEDNRFPFAETLHECCAGVLDSRGRLPQHARDLLALHAVFVFRKGEARLRGSPPASPFSPLSDA